MRFSWLILCLLIPFATLAQSGLITGKVIHAYAKAPIAQASVFLSNTSYGTATLEDGTFRLSNLKPGQYTLVVSVIGYVSYSQIIQVGSEPINLNIELIPKVTQLREVTVTTPANWKKNYELFVKDFIGTDDNAKYCFITNPHDIILSYHKTKEILEASTNDFLVIENRALGYRIKCIVDSFSVNGLMQTKILLWERYFQELPGSKKQQKIWHYNRQAVYFGSKMHFYRSLYTNRLDSEGFIMMKLTQSLNPQRSQEGLIHQKINYFEHIGNRDSLRYWVGQEDMSKYYHENLDRKHLTPYDILYSLDGHPGIFVVNFTGYYLYVIYTKKTEQTDFKDIYRPLDMPNYQTSVVTSLQPYYFDTNGVDNGVIPPFYDGTWSKSTVSDMLPDNYAPDEK